MLHGSHIMKNIVTNALYCAAYCHWRVTLVENRERPLKYQFVLLLGTRIQSNFMFIAHTLWERVESLLTFHIPYETLGNNTVYNHLSCV